MTPRLLIVDHTAADFERSRIGLARRARALGFEVTVAVPERPSNADGFAVHLFPLARLGTAPRDEARTLAALVGLYARSRPTVVHHFGIKPALYGGLAARLVGVPGVVTTFTGLGYLAGTSGSPVRAAALAGLRVALGSSANRIVCQVEEDASALLRAGIGAPERMHVIEGFGVDVQRYRETPEQAGVPIVLMAARLLAEKGARDFVKAADVLRRRGIHARFVLLGALETAHPSAIPADVIASWVASRSIEWLGWQHDMPRWLSDAHVVCLPTTYGEGVPRVLLEGAASARPIVASNLPGCRKAVRHGETGLLVEAGNVTALADAIAKLLGDAGLRSRMGVAGRRHMCTRFDEDRISKQYLALYTERACAS
jgi:glycosyltransferase involved in cell wall biosynthesis